MLHIILLILKITGIILLCILGLLLLSLCCALFVPLRYRIEVSREEGEEKPPLLVRIKITWLLHLVNILICYPSDVYVRARIFLFTLFRLPEKEKEQKKSGRRRQSGKAGPADPDAPAKTSENLSRQENGRIQEETSLAEPDRKDGLLAEAEQNGDEEDAFGFIEKIIRKIRRFIDKIKRMAAKWKAAIENIQYTIRRFCDKIKAASEQIRYYREVLDSEPFRQTWALCRKQIEVILKGLKPDKFEADLVIGTEDPAATGEILAIYGMLYPWIGQHVRVAGDFERARMEGCIYIKGKIRAFTFLRVAVKFYFNKDIKALIKLFKKEAV